MNELEAAGTKGSQIDLKNLKKINALVAPCDRLSLAECIH